MEKDNDNIKTLIDKKEKNNILNFINNKKNIILIIVIFILVIGILFFLKNNNSKETNSTTYEEIEKIINDKEDAVIYYYNSKSSNKNNKDIKKYLDKLGIRYYLYDDVNVDKKEYNKLLKLLNINEDLFGLPAIIYIEDGEMNSNIINIEGRDTVKKFIDDYDLYTVK